MTIRIISRRWRSRSTRILRRLPFQPELIVASFHGMPQKYIDKGDPYQAQCIATTDALRKRMGLDATKLMLTFQSRFGFDEWLQPYTDKTIEQLAKDGVRRIAVVTPGFSADCLETLEEIAQENAEIFKHNGGEQFAAIPCLNDSDAGMDVIRQLVLRELARLDMTIHSDVALLARTKCGIWPSFRPVHLARPATPPYAIATSRTAG